MKTSKDRILTTHVGSLPRPPDVLRLLIAREKGEAVAATADEEIDRAVASCMQSQVDAGVDVVNDGEIGKFSYALYAKDRLRGIAPMPEAEARNYSIKPGRDVLDHPDFAARQRAAGASMFSAVRPYVCAGAVTYGGQAALTRDLDRIEAGRRAAKPLDIFMTSASPGLLGRQFPDRHYASEDSFLLAMAEAMKTEYHAIVDAGAVLQLDCPDLASARNNVHMDKTDDEFVKIIARNIEALNHATAAIPPEKMRMHICWGNYAGPHTHDIALAKILSTCLRGRPAAISFEGANPRHAHEWEDLAAIKIPDDKILMPGVIDSTTNFVEHPRLVAQRIQRYARIVGRERIIASVDCGFGSYATADGVVPSIVWAKLKSLREGADIASKALWT